MCVIKYELEEKILDFLMLFKKDFYVQFLGGVGYLLFSMYGFNDVE